MAILTTEARGVWSKPVLELGQAFFYAVGFVLVVLGRTTLFTEQTTLTVFPVLAGLARVRDLLRFWGVPPLQRAGRSSLFAFLAPKVAAPLGVLDLEVLGQLAKAKTTLTWGASLGSAIGAGWLMGLLTWLVTTARDTTAQILCVFLITGMIGFGHLHHSVAGTAEILMAVFAGHGVSFFDWLRFLWWAALGNAVGGAAFVALLRFAYVHQAAQS